MSFAAGRWRASQFCEAARGFMTSGGTFLAIEDQLRERRR